MRKIKTGDKVPQFKLLNQDGKLIDISNYLGKPIIIFFYPKDDTPGCIKEVCSFRDWYEQLTEANVTVFGISADTVGSHGSFKQKYHLPFDLLSDENNLVRASFGVPADLFGFIPGRVTYVIDNQGIVRHVINAQLNFKKHVEESLKIVKSFSPISKE